MVTKCDVQKHLSHNDAANFRLLLLLFDNQKPLLEEIQADILRITKVQACEEINVEVYTKMSLKTWDRVKGHGSRAGGYPVTGSRAMEVGLEDIQ
jgi:hypothetical protein